MATATAPASAPKQVFYQKLVYGKTWEQGSVDDSMAFNMQTIEGPCLLSINRSICVVYHFCYDGKYFRWRYNDMSEPLKHLIYLAQEYKVKPEFYELFYSYASGKYTHAPSKDEVNACFY